MADGTNDSGSPERVGYDLFRYIMSDTAIGGDGNERVKRMLDLYSACRLVARTGTVDTNSLTIG
jgi:hypothetical protein